MTTDPTHEPFTQEEVATFAAKLEAWTAQLPPREQQFVARLVTRATATGEDVQGYFLDPRFNTAFSAIGSPPPPLVGGGGGSLPPASVSQRLK